MGSSRSAASSPRPASRLPRALTTRTARGPRQRGRWFDAVTTGVIERVHAETLGVYGARKVHAELRRRGQPVARYTIERLMRTAGLRGIARAKGPRTTVPGTGPDTRPDLV